MSFLDKLFGRKEPKEPPGKGLGPAGYSRTVKDDSLNAATPYVKAAPTYADGPTDVIASQNWPKAEERGFKQPANIPPEKYSRKADGTIMQEVNPQEHLQSGDGSQFGYSGAPRTVIKGFAGDVGGNWTAPDVERIIRSPSNYRFTRPWNLAPRLNGNHFSLADNVNNYPSEPFGMTPSGFRRNTYRVEPPPRDAHIVDTTAETSMNADGPVHAVTVSSGQIYSSRSYRLT